jgi:hypothetical protein
LKRKLSILPLELQTSNQLDSQNQEAHERCCETDAARMRDPGEGTEANAAAEFTSPLAANEIITAGINADAKPTTSAAANEIITAGIAAKPGGEAPKPPAEAPKPPSLTPAEAPKPPTEAPEPPDEFTRPLVANNITTTGIDADAEPTTSAAANEIITAGIAAMFGGEAPKSPTEAHKPPTPTPTEAPKPPTDAPKPPWRWHSSKRRLEEGDNDPTWLARKKHFFILSDAGKPIYSRCADVRI